MNFTFPLKRLKDDRNLFIILSFIISMVKCILSKGDDPIKQISEGLSIIEEMNSLYKKKEEIVLDLSGIEWILPCSALLLSGKIMGFIDKGIKIKYIEPSKESVKDYLKEVGFPLGSKMDGRTYSPIKHFGRDKEINREVSNLLNNLNDKVPGHFGTSIHYILAELSDNIQQHSRFSYASIMAQYYPQKKYVDLGVLDDGMSIPCLFEENNIKFSKDSEAINLALTGTTTKKGDGPRGFGLRSTREIVKKALNGKMYVISRKGVVIINPESKDKSYDFSKESLSGTILYMRLNTPKEYLNIYPYL